jgi:hypothetical protein
MNRYVVINNENIVVNMCLWDGITEWNPGSDDNGNPLTAVLDTDPPTANYGLLYQDGAFVPAPPTL